MIPGLVLVTGANGRQGGVVARHLLASSAFVQALTRNLGSDPARRLAADDAKVVTGDLDDPGSLEGRCGSATASAACRTSPSAPHGRYGRAATSRERRNCHEALGTHGSTFIPSRSDGQTLAGLSPGQWAAASWCEGWSVQDTAGHIVAAAEQTPANFYKETIAAGFRFNVFADRAARRLASVGPDELIRRLRARTSTTNHPPAPVMAMLGEIIVHGADIRRPLGLQHRPPEAAAT